MSSRVQRVAALLCAAAALLPATTAHAAAPSVTLSGPTARMYEAINAARARSGLPAVAYSKSLAAASTRYAGVLGSHHAFQHASRIGRAHYKVVGEILARSTGRHASIGPVVDAWLESPVHRPILLGAEFRSVGLGMVHARYGGGWWTVWVVRFGKR